MLVSTALAIGAALAGPSKLPEYIVTPDPLEPALIREESDDGPPSLHLALPKLVPELPHDLRPILMLLETVDTPPELLDDPSVSAAQGCDLRITVDQQGRTTRVRVVHCDRRGLARRARRVARDLRFSPATYEGQPVAVADLPMKVKVDNRDR